MYTYIYILYVICNYIYVCIRNWSPFPSFSGHTETQFRFRDTLPGWKVCQEPPNSPQRSWAPFPWWRHGI